MSRKELNSDEVLGRIQKMETPPYLLTRIHSKLEQMNDALLSRPKIVLVGSLFTLLLAINFLVVKDNLKQTQQENISAVANDFGLTSSNQLYHE